MFRFKVSFAFLLAMLLIGCAKEDDKVALTVKTAPVSSISGTSAIAGGMVENSTGIVITEKGICYSTTSSLTGAIKKIVSTTKDENFTVTLTDLAAKTTYYVRAYAVSSTGTVFYGDPVSFSTTEASVAGLFPDAQYSYTSGSILFAGADAYSYTTGCNLYTKAGKYGFKLEVFRSLIVKDATSQGLKLSFAINASQVELGKEYTFGVPLYGEATSDFYGNFANPTKLDDRNYVWYDDQSTVAFSIFTPNQIKGKITGRVARFSTGIRSRAEVSFDFTK